MIRGSLIAVLLSYVALALTGCTSSTSSKPVTVTVTAPGGVSAQGTSAPPAAPVRPPGPSDFVVDVTVTEQKCYGSAGCNYHLNIDPRYIGAANLTVGRNWLVIYEIRGGDDPQTGNFRLDGDNVRWDEEKTIQGPAGTVFAAKVTQVIEQHH